MAPIDVPRFKKIIEESQAVLLALSQLIPDRIDKEVISYLERVQNDPVGLELLRNAIRPQTSP